MARKSGRKKSKNSHKITRKPTDRPRNMSKPKRDGMKLTVKWGTASRTKSVTNHHRAESEDIAVTVNHKTKGSKSKPKGRTYRTNNAVLGKTSKEFTIAKSNYYPNTKQVITSVVFSVNYNNSKGNGKKTKTSYRFDKPAQPHISASFDPDTGKVTFDIKAGRDTAAHQHTDTAWSIVASGKHENSSSGAFTSDEASRGIDIPNWAGLGYGNGDYVRVRCKAHGRGVAGDGPSYTCDFYIGQPQVFAIRSNDMSKTGSEASDKIIFPVGRVYRDVDGSKAQQDAYNDSYRTRHPVTKVQLQVLKDSTAKTASAAQASTDWADVDGAVDNGNCAALSDSVGNATAPTDGHRNWYRVASYFYTLVSYSNPVCISMVDGFQSLYSAPATAADDAAAVTSVVPAADGKSVWAYLGWAADDSDGTQVSWSTDPEAWESTASLETYDMTKAASDTSAFPALPTGTTWANRARVKITGLESNREVFVSARRFLKNAEGDTEYGDWCAPTGATPSAKPDNVAISAPAAVAKGRGCRISWTYSGGGTQTQWALYVDGRDAPVIRGAGTDGSVLLTSGQMEALATDGKLSVHVSVTTGGDWVDSKTTPIVITDPPTVACYPPTDSDGNGLIASTPIALRVECDKPDASLHVSVKAHGGRGEGPGGDWYQPDGETVFSADIPAPAWTAKADAAGTYETTVSIPASDGLREGCIYLLQAIATSSGLTTASDAVAAEVAWSHQAAAPKDTSTVEAFIDVTDGNDANDSPTSIGDRYVEITPAAPDGAAPTDVCDIYRVTPLGAELVAEGCSFGTTYTDRFAPFSASRYGVMYDARTGERIDKLPGQDYMPETFADLRYRLVTRTADGDIDWDDFEYDTYIPCHYARIDWGVDDWVELPWDLEWTVQADKNAKIQGYLDGGYDGFWPTSPQLTGSVSTDLIRLGDPHQVEAVLALAQYQGPCFVRLPDGCAFAADVNLTGFSQTDGESKAAASLSISVVRTPELYLIDKTKASGTTAGIVDAADTTDSSTSETAEAVDTATEA